MLSLKQSHLDGLHYLRLAKCSPIVMVRIQMEKSPTLRGAENICQFILGLDITIKIHFTVIIWNQIKH